MNVKSIIGSLGLAFMVIAGSVSGEEAKMLKCELAAPEQVKLGEPVELKFKLINTSEQAVWVLKWNTPLEGWFGSSFNVTRDGQWVNYIGAMVKRWKPSDGDYSEIAPGQSIENRVNLADGYDLKAAGEYKLVFNGRLQDVQHLAKGETLAKRRKMHSLKCDELLIKINP